ncbi:MAG: hypothetical protein DRG40_00700 [Deltaproteobacteria bacterium]|nr:MAG: hypothetical protein DRG40_00700 [Deltaproteobacteria bacterium]
MAIKALRLGETWEYVSKFDPDKENPTVWILGTLDSEVYSLLMDELAVYRVEGGQPEPDMKLNYFERNLRTVQYGLKGWKNFKDEKGKEIPFETERRGKHEVVRADLVRRIPFPVIQELAEEILKANTLTEEEAKNSE